MGISDNDKTPFGEQERERQAITLRDALLKDRKNAASWYQLALLMTEPERVKYCLEQALKVDADHADARRLLEWLSADGHSALPSPGLEPETEQESLCPFVGLYDDPQSLTSYPSSINACHLFNPPKQIRQKHQKEYCLTAVYVDCKVYQSRPDDSKNPLDEKPEQKKKNQTHSRGLF